MLEVRNVSYGYPVLGGAGGPAAAGGAATAGEPQVDGAGVASGTGVGGAGAANSQAVLRGASLALRPGERVALLGYNGSGKSTLLRVACAGIVPADGEVLREGRPLAWDSAAELMAHRREVGVVGQDPDDQMVATTVFEEVAFGPCNLGLPEAEVRGRVAEALRRCRLEGLDARDVSTLSGGQRQRVALAGILAMRPRYLLLDEPCSMLDAAARAEVLAVVDDAARAGCGVLHVTHELADVIDYDRALVMDEGRIAWEGTPRALLLDEGVCADSCCLVSDWLLEARALLRSGVLPADAPLSDARACGELVGRACGAEDAARVGSDDGARAGWPASADGGDVRAEGAVPAGGGDGVRAGAAAARVAGDAGGASLVARDVAYAYDAPDGGRRRRGDARSQRPLTYAVQGVDLTLARGATTLVSGPTGSGKSTLMRLFAGLLRPVAGEVRVGGEPTSPAAVACSFQRAEDQLFADTVLEDVAFGPHNLGCTTAQAQKRAREALAQVGLDPEAFGARSPFCLSGGQMRRVALAGILAMGTPFVALDEPTVGLDARGLDDLRPLLAAVRGRGVGVVIVSHDVERCLPLVDELIVLDAGRVTLRCPAPDARRDPALLARAGLGLTPQAAFEQGVRGTRECDGRRAGGRGAGLRNADAAGVAR